jgi:predicted transcriptional regulator
MSSRCESIGKYVLPVFRSFIAEELVRTYHLTQIEAAKKLGTTQAAISQYLSSKRAYKSTEQFSDALPKIRAMARETAKRLAMNEIGSDEVAIDICKLCSTLGDEEEPRQIADDYAI